MTLDRATCTREIWAADVDTSSTKAWVEEVGEQIITQLELLPVVLERRRSKQLFHNRRLLFFLDNTAACDSLIAGGSKSPCSDMLIRSFYEVEQLMPCYAWFSRVPSSSNPADMPSRGQIAAAAAMFNATIVTPPVVPHHFLSCHRGDSPDRGSVRVAG